MLGQEKNLTKYLQRQLRNRKKTAGKRTVQGCGSQIYYFCNNKIKESEKDYKECSCEVDKYNRAQAGNNGKFSTSEQGANGCGDFWICNQEILTDQATYDSKCKKTTPEQTNPGDSCGRIPHPKCDLRKHWKRSTCYAYSKCKGRI